MKSLSSFKEGDVVTAKDIPALAKKLTTHDDNLFFMENTVGKVLTIIDASTPEKDQCKAIKDLIKDAMWGNFKIFQNWYLDQDSGMASTFPFRKEKIVTI